MYFLAIFLLILVSKIYTTPVLDIFYCNNCDIILGGLVPVHAKDSRETHKGQCGPENSFNDWAMPRVEALLFAVEQVNKDPNLLTNYTLGIHIQDTCGIESIATDKAKKFLRNACDSGWNKGPGSRGQEARSPKYFAGVIGEMYSKVSITLATFLQPWNVPMVSPASTSVELSDKSRYKYFARTVPSDKFQNRVIIDILKKLNWTLVSTIVSKGSFSEEIREFKSLAEKNGICNSVHESIPSNPSRLDFEEVVCTLFNQVDTNVVVLFTNVENTKGLLNATKNLKQGKSGKF